MCLAKSFLQCQLQEKQFVNGQMEQYLTKSVLGKLGKTVQPLLAQKSAQWLETG